ncbi:MAG: potassium transporter KtrB [Chlamydiae bacterium]|nr:potassium transporter KtrB [Chlamydiota bacterium]
MRALKSFRSLYTKLTPSQSILLGYLAYALISAIILLQPVFHKVEISFVDSFFTTVSSVTATGLTTLNIAACYTFWGQFWILVLIQIGGVGYMTFSSFVVLAISRHVSTHKKKILSCSFSFPSDFSLKEFVYNMVVFSFIAEVIGAVLLSILFMNRGVENYIWAGVFHSVSAFCTAGFSIFQDGFIPYVTDVPVNIVVCILMLLGGVGFIVFLDLYKRVTGQRSRLTFTSKAIIFITVLFVFLGTIFFYAFEQPFEHLTVSQQIFAALFQIISACTTTGYSTVNFGVLQAVTVVLLGFFMIFGSSPSGTGGGIKNTTFVALVALVRSTLRRQEYVSLFGNQIPEKRVQLATAIFSFNAFILFMGIFLICFLENKPFLMLSFEVISALGNAGTSLGVTPYLTSASKFLLMILMFISRVGVLTFGFSLIPQDTSIRPRLQKKDLIF